MSTTTCPVLAFTPEVESALRWFDATHDVVQGRYQRMCFPRAGGYGDQDQWLMHALDVLRHIHNDLLGAALQKTSPLREPEMA